MANKIFTLFSVIEKAFNKIFRNIYALLDHEGYTKWIGVNVKGDVFHIYGNPVDIFGTEPWLITLCNPVHITREVLFISQDGCTLLFRYLIPDIINKNTYCHW